MIKETLNKTDSMRKSGDQEYISYFADLAAAKFAKQIQSQESPTFDKVFIVFGQFHTECRIFAALGKIIDGSGGPFVLNEANIIATASLTKFLRGKMHNRCMLLSAAMHVLHIENEECKHSKRYNGGVEKMGEQERKTYTLSGADKFGMCL